MLVPPREDDADGSRLSHEQQLRALQEVVLTTMTHPAYEGYEANAPGEAAKLSSFAELAQAALLRLGRGEPVSSRDLSWVPRAREVCAAIAGELTRRPGGEAVAPPHPPAAGHLSDHLP